MKNNQPVIANYKIFVFVGFVCAALITSLFIYRINHLGKAALVNNENSMIMPVGRDLKTVELVDSKGDAFTSRNLSSHWTLMFFGFTHCSNVCPVTLDMMAKSYDVLHKSIPDLQVVFVSLDPERDTKAALKKYTETFHPDFIGVSGKIENVRKLQSQLGIYSAKDPSSQNGDYQLQHTSSIMLINPQGQWIGMFKFGMTSDVFNQEVINAIDSIKQV